jgi:hypothetical protein
VSFSAKWSSGSCADCGDDILKGQLVEFNDDRELMHVLCPDDMALDGKPKPVCPRFFMQLPATGKCDECFPDD